MSEDHSFEEFGQQHRCGCAGEGGGGQVQAYPSIKAGGSTAPHQLPSVSERMQQR